MINIFGENTVIIDSDAIIGLVYEADSLHQRCVRIYDFLKAHDVYIFTPYAILLEAATTLARALKQPQLAEEILSSYSNLEDKMDIEVASLVAKLYQPKTSKKNTPFDHYVLALAKKNNIQIIFSFDAFYQKNGLVLMENLLQN